MNLLIIAGFLGSGKTTLLLKIAKRLSSSVNGVAVIENELGDIGIDGALLEIEGLQVRELFGGCICCTLSAGLAETLAELDRQAKPELVILEATGVANPEDIAANMRSCRLSLGEVRVITLVDAERYDMLMEVMTPLITGQVRAADIIILNKTDLADPEHIERMRGELQELNPGARVQALSLANDPDLDCVMELLPC